MRGARVVLVVSVLFCLLRYTICEVGIQGQDMLRNFGLGQQVKKAQVLHSGSYRLEADLLPRYGVVGRAMLKLTLEIPDEMARILEGMATAQHKTVEELALDRLRSLVDSRDSGRPGSPSAVRNALLGLPRVSVADVEALEDAIASGKLPVSTRDLSGE